MNIVTKRDLAEKAFRIEIAKTVEDSFVARSRFTIYNRMGTGFGLTPSQFVTIAEAEIGFEKGCRTEGTFLRRMQDFAVKVINRESSLSDNKIVFENAYAGIRAELRRLNNNRRVFNSKIVSIVGMKESLKSMVSNDEFRTMYPNSTSEMDKLIEKLEVREDVIRAEELRRADIQEELDTCKSSIPYSTALSRLHNSAIRRGKILHWSYLEV